MDISCLSFNLYCRAILFLLLFFLHFEKFEVNCLLGFVLGFELTVALVYLNLSGKPSSLLFRKDQRSEKAMKDTVRQ